MSRSRRKTPMLAITNAKSEKKDKGFAPRRRRSLLTSKFRPNVALSEDFDLPKQGDHPRSGQWTFAKDGKLFRGLKLNADDLKDMRK